MQGGRMKYDYIKICLGYPKSSCKERIIWRKWAGVEKGYYETGYYETGKLKYTHVYAIDVSKKIYENQHLAPNQFGKKVITFNLKRIFFEQIRDGIKKYEFREIKPYWEKRLSRVATRPAATNTSNECHNGKLTNPGYNNYEV